MELRFGMIYAVYEVFGYIIYENKWGGTLHGKAKIGILN